MTLSSRLSTHDYFNSTLNSTLHSWLLNPLHLDSQLTTISTRLSTHDYFISTLNSRLFHLHSQFTTISTRLSTHDYLNSTLNSRLPGKTARSFGLTALRPSRNIVYGSSDISRPVVYNTFTIHTIIHKTLICFIRSLISYSNFSLNINLQSLYIFSNYIQILPM